MVCRQCFDLGRQPFQVVRLKLLEGFPALLLQLLQLLFALHGSLAFFGQLLGLRRHFAAYRADVFLGDLTHTGGAAVAGL